jgi:uncharacterized membrane protein YkvA (DUF1232 family)
LFAQPSAGFPARRRKEDSVTDTKQRFVETMTSWLVSLPHDLKVLYEAAADENLERPIRELAVGAIIYVVSPTDYISDRSDSFISYCDDCLLLRLAMVRIAEAEDEDSEFFRSRFPEFFEPLTDELAVCESAMGDLYEWFRSKTDGLRSLNYKGKKVAVYLDDEEARDFLYEDGLGFRTEYDIDEESLADSFKKASTVIERLERRKREEDRRKKG